MKTSPLIYLSAFMCISSSLGAQTQQELDAACEAARESKLAPLRQQHIDECVQKQKKDLDHCTKFYSDYGSKTGNRAPLFYDLPECKKAFDFKKSSGNRK